MSKHWVTEAVVRFAFDGGPAEGKMAKSSDHFATLDALRGILDAIPHPLFVEEEDGRVVAVNRAMCATIGKSHQELIGQIDRGLVALGGEIELGTHSLALSGEELARGIVREPCSLADGTRLVVGFLADSGEAGLRAALHESQFTLAFQPIRGTGDLDIVCFEALIRWKHPTRGEVDPSEFICVAEHTGLVVPIAEWVLAEACTEAMRWARPIGVAVNISPSHFARDLPALVRAVLGETGLDPSRLDIEITETAVIKDLAVARGIFEELRGIGVGIVLDDFGAGYSSLQILKSLRFDKIKIDRSLLHDVGRSAQADAIISAVLCLTRTLDLTVIAEGVETDEQLAVMRSEGCNQIQGYLLGGPRPIADYANLVDPPLIERRA